MNEKFLVYVHERPDTNAIFYVGKGTEKRSKQTSNRSNYWHNIVAKAGGFCAHIVLRDLVEHEALELEKALIAEMRNNNVPICNLTDGGDGISGYKFSAETRQKMSERRKGRTSPTKGKSLSEEHRNKLRLAKLGKKQSAEHKQNSAKARLGIKKSPEERKRMSERMLGKKMPKEAVAKKFRPVFCTTTGVEYESVTAAANTLGLETTNISRCCKGVFKQTKGYSFEYLTS